ncbi:MAG: putative metal-binding motif-containing protein [Alphaproteobacteria bacterium]|nr:putative metal-binding motif-containing protein [Alphaproteobacteria bacterium]
MRLARCAPLLLSLTACVEPVISTFNEPPFVVIQQPQEDITVTLGTTVELVGKVADDGPVGKVVAQWLDNGSEELATDLRPDPQGLVTLSVADLAEGAHAIMLRAVDPEGLFGDATVTVTVQRVVEAPSLTVVRPTDSDRGRQASPFTFEATVSDAQDPPERLVVEVQSALDGILCTTPADEQGTAICQGTPRTAGSHELTFTVRDTEDHVTQRKAVLLVDPLRQEPTITVTAPAQNAVVRLGVATPLEATVADQQDAPESLTVTAESDVDGPLCTLRADATGAAACFGILATAGSQTLTFTVTDRDGNSASAFRLVTGIDPRDIDDDGDGETENQGDCDDADAKVSSGATELPNGRDDNCDGKADEGTDRYDDDGDGHCESLVSCTDGSLPGDCDDTAPAVNPGATETCATPWDDDCDTQTEDEDAVGCTEWYLDADGDRFGTDASRHCTCTVPFNGVPNGGDCNDAAPAIHPAMSDIANGLDDNCNGNADEGTTRYDNDGDGYCAASSCTPQPDGRTFLPDDCNDGRTDIHPGAAEVCNNGVDDNCAGGQDEGEDGPGCLDWWADNDNDGYGAGASRCFCDATGVYKRRNANDCYDANPNAYPGQQQWFTSDRGDGSFDYNCDTKETPELEDEYQCACKVRLDIGPISIPFTIDPFEAGWQDVPDCGDQGTWYRSCEFATIDVEDTAGVGFEFCIPGLSEDARTEIRRLGCK